jgi:PAS domain-containing protein
MKDLMDSLYQRAEATLRQRTHQSPGQFAALSPVEAQRMLHDLQVHQVELDLQNEDLRCAHLALHAAQVDYFDFYDLAPVGYLSVCENGLISQANLTAANLLGQPRNQLIHQPISHLVFKDDHHIYYAFRHRLLTDGHAPPCELRLLKLDSQPFWARLAAVLFVNHETPHADILRWADAAMYQAKDAGRNTIRFYEANDENSRN